MKGGHLNLHSGPGGSLTAVSADLETLWAYTIQSALNIPLRDLGVGMKTHDARTELTSHKIETELVYLL